MATTFTEATMLDFMKYTGQMKGGKRRNQIIFIADPDHFPGGSLINQREGVNVINAVGSTEFYED